MSVVRPSSLVPAEALLDAVTYHSDPELWSGDSLMVSFYVPGEVEAVWFTRRRLRHR